MAVPLDIARADEARVEGARVEDAGSDGARAGEAGFGAAGVEAALRVIASHFEVAFGEAERVALACASLDVALARAPEVESSVFERMVPLLGRRRGPVAVALFEFLAERARRASSLPACVFELARAADADLARRALALLAERAAAGALRAGLRELDSLCASFSDSPSAEEASSRAALVEPLLAALPRAEWPIDAEDPTTAVFLGGPAAVRPFAAKVLDGVGPPSPALVARLLGDEDAAALAPHLQYTRAGHRDLVALSPAGRGPGVLARCVREAEALCGRRLVGELLGELGFASVALGFSVHSFVAESLQGSLPFVVAPDEGPLLRALGPCERVWSRFLVLAHGGEGGARGDDAAAVEIQRFRRLNVLHAEALAEILEIAPLRPAKARRILDLVGEICALVHALFASRDPELADLPALWSSLETRVRAALVGAPEGAPLDAETTRLVQMFEDPRGLAEVRTVHGCKRYLHQHGLRLAFKLFRGAGGQSRTVDLAVASDRRVLVVARVIRYLDFEPESAKDELGLPRVVAMAARAFGRHLLLEPERALPTLRILGFGNELQLYAAFRNHPAFIRVDLSPPLRGGMIDLEYYAVSQFELEHHPDLSLQGIQRFFRALAFDVVREGLKLRARFDKERARDLGELVEKLRALLALVPHLMEVDWAVASLDYAEETRAVIADAWAERFVAWGRLPLPLLRTRDGRKILAGFVPSAAGPRERPWDGRGAYADRFAGALGDLVPRLRAFLDARGLGELARWADVAAASPGQHLLERALLEPLREARVRGEIEARPDGFARASAEAFAREHEADRFARLLRDGGAALDDALALGALVAAIERHLAPHKSGTLSGYTVQRGELPLCEGPVGLFLLRDEDEIPRLAIAAEGGVLYRAQGDGAARCEPELGAVELARRLRRDNYLDASVEPARTVTAPGGVSWPSYFARPNPRARPPLPSGERAVPAIPASPGRGAGLARLDARTSELDGAVLVAPSLRPEDAPRLARAAAIVATGGGVLSHAGLVALELGKPSVIVPGRWRRAPGEPPRLSCARPEFRAEQARLGAYAIVRWRDLRAVDEPVVDGDLVVVDGESGVLTILGQAPESLALHAELRALDAARARIDLAVDDERLALRGRLLRSAHALRRLIADLRRADLLRYATGTLVEAAAGASGSLAEEAQLVRALLAHPLGAEARRVVDEARERLVRRAESLCAERPPAMATSPGLQAFALLARRLEQRRIAAGLARIDALAGGAPPEGGERIERNGGRDRKEGIERKAGSAEISASGAAASTVDDREARSELLALRDLAARRALEPARTSFSRRRELEAVARIEAVLGPPAAPSPSIASAVARLRAEDAERLEAARGRRLLRDDEITAAHRELCGPKATMLAEVARGAELRVPPFFVVTDVAFRDLLAGPSGRSNVEGLEAAATLGAAIAAVHAHGEWPSARRSAVIRELWRGAPLPPSLVAEVRAAYAALASDAAAPFVAVRSSGVEEDAEVASAAGRFDTFLYVRGEESLLEHLRLAWAGLWSERALEERVREGAAERCAGGGIIVQRIVAARVSGVMFTLDAANRRAGELVLNVGLGLGEGVVSGKVEVDQIFVAKNEGLRTGPVTFRYRVGDKREAVVFDALSGQGTRVEETRYHQRLRPALEYVELVEIARTGVALEELFGVPLDVELALEGSHLFILQARPIALCHAVFEDILRRHPLAAPRGSSP